MILPNYGFELERTHDEERIAKPRCLGKYEKEHVACDGKYNEDDPCLLRDLCVSIPRLSAAKGVSPLRLVEELSLKELEDIHSGRFEVKPRGKPSGKLLLLKKPRSKKRLQIWYREETWQQYRFLVQQLRDRFESHRVVSQLHLRPIDDYQRRHWETRKVLVGDLVLYLQRFDKRRGILTWRCKTRGAFIGPEIFQIAPRYLPLGLDIRLGFFPSTLRVYLGERLFDKLNPLSYAPYYGGKCRMKAVVKAANYERTEIVAEFLQRFADEGRLGRWSER